MVVNLPRCLRARQHPHNGRICREAPRLRLISIQRAGHACHYFWSHDGIHPGQSHNGASETLRFFGCKKRIFKKRKHFSKTDLTARRLWSKQQVGNGREQHQPAAVPPRNGWLPQATTEGSHAAEQLELKDNFKTASGLETEEELRTDRSFTAGAGPRPPGPASDLRGSSQLHADVM